MATENLNRPDRFYQDLIQRLLATDETLVQLVRRELDGVQRITEDAAARLERLAAGRYSDS